MNGRFLDLGSDKDAGSSDEIWIRLTERVFGVEPLKVDGSRGDGYLPQQHALAELLDQGREEYVEAVQLVLCRIL